MKILYRRVRLKDEEALKTLGTLQRFIDWLMMRSIRKIRSSLSRKIRSRWIRVAISTMIQEDLTRHIRHKLTYMLMSSCQVCRKVVEARRRVA